MKTLLAALPLLIFAGACGSQGPSPAAPTRALLAQPQATTSGFGTIAVSAQGAPSFAACLSGASTAGCFSAARLNSRSATSNAAVGTPLTLSASASGSTVTLTWSAPPLSAVTAYMIEAGSATGGANLANFSTGNSLTTFSATGIGAGVYYVRVRAVGAAGEVGLASNEAVLVVGGTAPCSTPGAPSALTVVSAAGGTVVLNWSAATGTPTTYLVEAGSSSGLANLANSDLGSSALALTASGVGNGTYYVRVRAKNTCGTSGPSNEVVFVMGSTPTQTPTPTPTGSFGPGDFRVGTSISAGRYYSVPSSFCYWKRVSGFGGSFAEIIANNISPDLAQTIVDILPTDYGFSNSGCGTWFTSARFGQQSAIPAGMWLVGSQVAPGTYQASVQSGCYWKRMRDFTQGSDHIIANDFVSGASVRTVTIAATDTGFETRAACGTWTRVSAITTSAFASQSRDEIDANDAAARAPISR